MNITRAFGRLLFHAFACLALCAAAGHLAAAHAQCENPRDWVTKTNKLRWESFKPPGLSGKPAQCYRLPDGDIISLTRKPLPGRFTPSPPRAKSTGRRAYPEA